MKNFFRNFASFSISASGNQTFFQGDSDIMESLVFYRLLFPQETTLSLLFSDSIDSTFEDGSRSKAGDTLGEWTILSAAAAVTELPDPELSSQEMPLTFCGYRKKSVKAGEWFASDPITMPAGNYLRLHLTFQGKLLPCLEESLLDSYRMVAGRWTPSTYTPLAAMVGSSRPVKIRLGFLGDSITQGIGTQPGSYQGFVSKTAELLGERCAVWNLGLGYGRASDAAQNGSWLLKASECSHVVLCLGTNDLLQTQNAARLMENISKIIRLLERAGVQVFLQALPPFDYQGNLAKSWREVNRFILDKLGKTLPVLDTPSFLSGRQGHEAVYGGHPNAQGCEIWARQLYPKLMSWL